jgi:hypothetical protein
MIKIKMPPFIPGRLLGYKKIRLGESEMVLA